MASSHSQPAWKRVEVRFMTPKIIMWYTWKIFGEIEITLKAVGGEPLVERFTRGCFRQLFHWKPGNSPSRALHALLSYEIESPNSDELWFRVHGTSFSFNPRHYALVSGLHFGHSSFDPREEPHDLSRVGVYNRVGKGKRIQLRQLRREFRDQILYKIESYNEKEDDYLKVANILALYYFYLGYDDSRKVEDWAWILVDDLDMWNRFPWGSYTYDALVHYTERIPRTTDDMGTQYHVYGPMWALQVWSFETIPKLGNFIGSRSQSSVVPRALRWKFGTVSGDVDFSNIFGEEFVWDDMIVDALETKQDYWYNILHIEEWFGVRFFSSDNPIQPRQVVDGKPVLFRKKTKKIKNMDRSLSNNAWTKIEDDNDEEVVRRTEHRMRGKRKTIASGSSSRLPEQDERISLEQYQQLNEDLFKRIQHEIVPTIEKNILKNMKIWMKSFFCKSGGSRDEDQQSRSETTARHSISAERDESHRVVDREMSRHSVSTTLVASSFGSVSSSPG